MVSMVPMGQVVVHYTVPTLLIILIAGENDPTLGSCSLQSEPSRLIKLNSLRWCKRSRNVNSDLRFGNRLSVGLVT